MSTAFFSHDSLLYFFFYFETEFVLDPRLSTVPRVWLFSSPSVRHLRSRVEGLDICGRS